MGFSYALSTFGFAEGLRSLRPKIYILVIPSKCNTGKKSRLWA